MLTTPVTVNERHDDVSHDDSRDVTVSSCLGDMSLVVFDDRILVEGVLNAAHLVNKSAHC